MFCWLFHKPPSIYLQWNVIYSFLCLWKSVLLLYMATFPYIVLITRRNLVSSSRQNIHIYLMWSPQWREIKYIHLFSFIHKQHTTFFNQEEYKNKCYCKMRKHRNSDCNTSHNLIFNIFAISSVDRLALTSIYSFIGQYNIIF